jgi:tellurite resistance protein
VLVILFIAKWVGNRTQAIGEAFHPVQCDFIGLAGVSTILVGVATQPYSHRTARALFMLGAIFTIGFAVWRTGALWQGERDPASTTPELYLPTVAGSFVMAIGCGAMLPPPAAVRSPPAEQLLPA